jgi:hypothetical protein
MNPRPELENMNCCQPEQFGDAVEGGGGVQLELLNVLVLSCSEKLFAPAAPLSLIAAVALSKNPTAVDIKPAARATEPLRPLKVSRRGPTASG